MFLLFLTTIKPALMKNTANLILKKLSNGIDRIVLAKTETGVWCLLITDLVRTSLMIIEHGDHDFNCECRKYFKVKVLVVVVILLNRICR